MAKEQDGNMVGQDEKTFPDLSQEDNSTLKPSEENPGREALYPVIFKEDRTFELYVAGERIVFSSRTRNPIYPEKYAEGLPDSILNHPDFKSHSQYFNVVK